MVEKIIFFHNLKVGFKLECSTIIPFALWDVVVSLMKIVYIKLMWIQKKGDHNPWNNLVNDTKD